VAIQSRRLRHRWRLNAVHQLGGQASSSTVIDEPVHQHLGGIILGRHGAPSKTELIRGCWPFHCLRCSTTSSSDLKFCFGAAWSQFGRNAAVMNMLHELLGVFGSSPDACEERSEAFEVRSQHQTDRAR